MKKEIVGLVGICICIASYIGLIIMVDSGLPMGYLWIGAGAIAATVVLIVAHFDRISLSLGMIIFIALATIVIAIPLMMLYANESDPPCTISRQL